MYQCLRPSCEHFYDYVVPNFRNGVLICNFCNHEVTNVSPVSQEAAYSGNQALTEQLLAEPHNVNVNAAVRGTDLPCNSTFCPNHVTQPGAMCDMCNEFRSKGLIASSALAQETSSLTQQVREQQEQRFQHNGSPAAHQPTHTREKLLKCTYCTKIFAQTGHLNRHIRTHTGNKPHACKVCQKRFISNSDLIRHQLTHTSEKPHACTVCPLRFTLYGDLIRHQPTHTGDKPYACTVCPQRFADKSNLKQHMNTHTAVTRHICQICKKALTRKYDLTRHMKIHEK